MALTKNPDGSVTVSDETGRIPAFVLPPQVVPQLLPEERPTRVPAWLPTPDVALPMPTSAPTPVPAPQLRQPETVPLAAEVAPAGLSLNAPVSPAQQAYSGAQPGPLSEAFGGATAGGAPFVMPPVAEAPLAGELSESEVAAAAPNVPRTAQKVVPGKIDPAELVEPAPAAGVSGAAPATKVPYSGDIASAALASELAIAPGGYTAPQPAKDIKRSFTVQKGVATKPETMALIEQAFAGRAAVEGEGARAVPEALQNVALAHARASEESRQEIAAIRNRQREQESALQDRMKVFDSHVARINNLADRDIVNEYLGSKGFGARLLIGLGSIGSALSRSPDTGMEMIRMELNALLQQQKMRIDAGHQTAADMLSAYGQMRATYLSPEAAEHAAMGLLTQATQATVLQAAARVTSDETRTKYLDVAAQLGIEFALLKQQAEQAEADKIAESWVHKEAVKGGYTPARRRSMLERLKLGQKYGLTTDQIMAIERGEMLPAKDAGKGQTRGEIDLQKFVGQLQVQLPDGTVMYAASEARAKEAENAIKTGTLHLKNLEKIKQLADKGISSGLPLAEKAKLETLIAENRYYLKGSLIKEALTAGELENYKPITAEEFLNVWRFKENATAQLEQIKEGALERIEAEKKTLYRAPLQPGTGYAAEQKAPEGAVRKY